jgi:hypothetical protein
MKEYKLSSFHDQVYGDWAGNPKGHKPKPNQCCERVSSGWHSKQCSRPRGFGPEEAYCKQHDPAKVAERRARGEAEFKIKMEKWKIESAAPIFLAALKKIANGHNDPRSLAIETIKDFKNTGE